jgi:hypothetical protein
MRSIDWRSVVLATCLGWFTLGCSGEDAGSEEAIGTAALEISTVPAGAQCLQVIGTGPSSFNVTAALTPGTSSASVSLARLPLGESTLNANVYDVACASIAGVQPTWVADPQSVTFRAGVATTLTLNLRQQNPVLVNANFVGNIVSMTAGYAATGLVLSDGTARNAGWWSPMGTGGAIFSTWTSPLLPAGVVELDAPRGFNGHGCSRTATQVHCWGSNSAGQIGTGVAVGSSSSSPIVVSGLSGVQELALGTTHSCARTTAGISCWGSNASGELGNNSLTSSATPVAVSGLAAAPDIVVAGQNFTCASTHSGVQCWGSNVSGQLGDGTTTNRQTATTINLLGTVSLAAGLNHVCAVRADGTARCWGNNASGQLSDGTTTQRLVPTQVPGLDDAVQVTAGAFHTCFRRTNNVVSCVGDNNYGQLGDGTATDRSTAASVVGTSGAVSVVAGGIHTCVLLDNSKVKCWGGDQSGQCGDGTPGNNYEPYEALVQ